MYYITITITITIKKYNVTLDDRVTRALGDVRSPPKAGL